MSASPGQACLVINADYRQVAPDGQQIVCDLRSLRLAEPPAARLFALSCAAGDLLEARAEAAARQVRLVAVHDAPTPYPAALLAHLRPYDLPCPELYWMAGESAYQALRRWQTDGRALIAQWPGQIGVVTQAYTMNGLRTVTEVEQLQPLIVGTVNDFGPRCAFVAPFAWTRADAVPSAVTLLAQATPGTPSFLPVPPPVPPITRRGSLLFPF